MEDRSDVFVLPHSHQDPHRTVVNVLEFFWMPLLGDADDKCMAVNH